MSVQDQPPRMRTITTITMTTASTTAKAMIAHFWIRASRWFTAGYPVQVSVGGASIIVRRRTTGGDEGRRCSKSTENSGVEGVTMGKKTSQQGSF
jgi:hypothetical protein